MRDEAKVVDLPETDEEFEIEAVKSDGKVTKAKNFIKKYGKKIAVAAAIGTVGLVGYVLGHKSKDDDGSVDDTIDGNYTEFEEVKGDEE